MKTSIAFVVLVLFVGCANIKDNAPAKPEQIRKEWVKDFPGLKKDVLFSRIAKGIGIIFVSAKSVIDVSDKEAGSIVGKGFIDLPTACKTGVYRNILLPVRYTFIVTIKDEKAKFEYLPSIEKIVGIERTTPNVKPELFSWFESAECFWLPMSTYFEKMTNDISDVALKEDNF